MGTKPVCLAEGAVTDKRGENGTGPVRLGLGG